MLLLPAPRIAARRRLAYDARMTGPSDRPTAKRNEVTLPVGIVVERRPSAHPWADEVWSPVDVLPNAPPARWLEVARQSRDGGEVVRYHAATLPLTLHRRETEALVENLALPVPVVFAVLEPGEGDWPWEPHVVTASPFEAQDHDDAGDAVLAKIPMPEALLALVQAFVAEHHREAPFHKRKRDRVRVEDEKFGKVPIFDKGFARSERDL